MSWNSKKHLDKIGQRAVVTHPTEMNRFSRITDKLVYSGDIVEITEWSSGGVYYGKVVNRNNNPHHHILPKYVSFKAYERLYGERND